MCFHTLFPSWDWRRIRAGTEVLCSTMICHEQWQLGTACLRRLGNGLWKSFTSGFAVFIQALPSSEGILLLWQSCSLVSVKIKGLATALISLFLLQLLASAQGTKSCFWQDRFCPVGNYREKRLQLDQLILVHTCDFETQMFNHPFGARWGNVCAQIKRTEEMGCISKSSNWMG